MRRNKPSPRDAHTRCEADLPAEITSIKPQKKRASRFSLYHHSSFIIGVSADTLLQFSLARGVTLSEKLFNQIDQKEQRNRANEYMLRLLGRRDHSRQELRTKSLQNGHHPAVIEEVLEQLESKGYINDNLFAKKYASDKASRMQWGPEKIRAALRKKGIPETVSQEALKSAGEDLQQDKICVDLVLKRSGHFLRETDDRVRKQKIIAYLQRRGFGYEIIRQALPEILNRL